MDNLRKRIEKLGGTLPDRPVEIMAQFSSELEDWRNYAHDLEHVIKVLVEAAEKNAEKAWMYDDLCK